MNDTEKLGLTFFIIGAFLAFTADGLVVLVGLAIGIAGSGLFMLGRK